MVQSAVGEYSMSYCTIYELIALEGADELKVECGSAGSEEVGRYLMDTSVQWYCLGPNFSLFIFACI